MKSSPGQQPEFASLGVQLLHASHVGGHQANDNIKESPIHRLDAAVLNEKSADFLQPQSVI
jgi:hypothetical protein